MHQSARSRLLQISRRWRQSGLLEEAAKGAVEEIGEAQTVEEAGQHQLVPARTLSPPLPPIPTTDTRVHATPLPKVIAISYAKSTIDGERMEILVLLRGNVR